MNKPTKKRLIFAYTLFILMIPVILAGIVIKFVQKYLEAGYMIWEHWEEHIGKWLDK